MVRGWGAPQRLHEHQSPGFVQGISGNCMSINVLLLHGIGGNCVTELCPTPRAPTDSSRTPTRGVQRHENGTHRHPEPTGRDSVARFDNDSGDSIQGVPTSSLVSVSVAAKLFSGKGKFRPKKTRQGEGMFWCPCGGCMSMNQRALYGAVVPIA